MWTGSIGRMAHVALDAIGGDTSTHRSESASVARLSLDTSDGRWSVSNTPHCGVDQDTSPRGEITYAAIFGITSIGHPYRQSTAAELGRVTTVRKPETRNRNLPVNNYNLPHMHVLMNSVPCHGIIGYF